MFDTPPALQRAKGRAHVAFDLDAGQTRIADLYQEGCAKASLPKVHRAEPEVVFLNTSGGITGGDLVSFSADLGDGFAAVATTQTAERAYATRGSFGQLDVSFTLGSGAALAWLPQETILFDNSALSRTTRVDMASDASLVLVDLITFGRDAMGETVRSIQMSDCRSVYKNGTLLWQDPLWLPSADALSRPEGFDCGRALASVFCTGPNLNRQAQIAQASGLAWSHWDDKLVIRHVTDDTYSLKKALVPLLRDLTGQDLPRVWQV